MGDFFGCTLEQCVLRESPMSKTPKNRILIVDDFYAKGANDSRVLLRLVANLLRPSTAQAIAHSRQSAPVWIPRNGKDARGIPYIVLTCTECLRSFPLNVSSEVTATVMETS